MSSSDLHSSSSAHSHVSRTGTATGSEPPKKGPLRGKENQFTDKYGNRHHSYDAEKAPYPLSYNRELLELEAADVALHVHVKRSMTFVKHPEGPPERCLELGCGAGYWILEAAKEWTGCEFVGFDLMNVQIPLQFVDEDIAARIEWKHGNFLSNRLPFEEDEFDFIIMRNCSKGIPETKWPTLFEEILRVLAPGGAVEIWEEDIYFPTLPQWFTSPLRSRARRAHSIHLPENSRPVIPSPPATPPPQEPGHDHALLESLYYAIFQNRFINLHPASIFTSYFNTYFTRVVSAPAVVFPMPPIRPPPPLPEMAYIRPASAFFPLGNHSDGPPENFAMARASTMPASTSSDTLSIASGGGANGSTLSHGDGSSTAVDTSDTMTTGSKESYAGSGSGSANSPAVVSFASPAESPITGIAGSNLFDEEERQRLFRMPDHMHAMQLYKVLEEILACREPMWEELQDRILNRMNRKDELKALGWDDDEETEELQNRRRFEVLVERYRSDIMARVSFWSALNDIGWTMPTRDPLSKAELLEEERIRHEILEASHMHEEEVVGHCRTAKVVYGFKPMYS